MFYAAYFMGVELLVNYFITNLILQYVSLFRYYYTRLF